MIFFFNWIITNRLCLFVFQARTEEHLAQEQAFLASERIWLLHRGGFTPASRCGSSDLDTGKLRVRLIPSGEELLVDEEDVEKVFIKSSRIVNNFSFNQKLKIKNNNLGLMPVF